MISDHKFLLDYSSNNHLEKEFKISHLSALEKIARTNKNEFNVDDIFREVFHKQKLLF